MTATEHTRQSEHTKNCHARTGATNTLRDVEQEGASWRQGEPFTIHVYGVKARIPVPLVLQAEYLDKLPDDRGWGRDVADLEASVARLEVEAHAVGLSLTGARAQ